MNKLTLGIVALLVLVGVTVGLGQTAGIDRTTLVYSKATYLDATATDTTQYYSLWDRAKGQATNLSVQGVATDSASIIIQYQLKNSVTGLTGSLTLLDTLTIANTGTSNSAALVGTLAQATLLGYDLIRFEQNYITGNGTTSGRIVKVYMHLVK